MTYIEIINTVLRQLREREVSSVTSNSYSQLIGQLVNQVIQEMEDTWDWARLVKSVSFTIPAGDRSIDLLDTNPDVTSNFATTSRSALVYDESRRPMVYDKTTEPGRILRQVPESAIRRQTNVQQTAIPTNAPSDFSISRANDDGWRMRFNTKMDVDRDFVTFWYTPTPELSVTSNADDNTEIILPSRPIILGTLYYAYNERGEELGEPGSIAERRYADALGAAVENDDREKQDYRYRFFANDETRNTTVRRGPSTGDRYY